MSPFKDKNSDRSSRARKARPSLLLWYDRNRRDLPWRRTRDPYRIWVSEIMLQQTTVRTVLGYYDRFLERFPTVVDLSRADSSEVLKLWEGLGYYQRARNLHRASVIVAGDSFAPRWPKSVEEWILLPGIGRSTAGAIHSISTDTWAPILDANVRRVTERFFGIPKDAPKNEKSLWEASDAWGINNPRPGDTNQALMELGAVCCLPASPLCPQCPVASFCLSKDGDLPLRTLSSPDAGSSKKKKGPLPQRERVALVPGSGPLLFEPRKEGRLLLGLLEISGFPSPELSPGETVREGAFRGWKVERPLFRVQHVYSHFREEVHVLLVVPPDTSEKTVDEDPGREGTWASPEDSKDLALTGVARKIVTRLRKDGR